MYSGQQKPNLNVNYINKAGEGGTKLHVLSVTFLYFSKTSVTVPPNRTVFLGGELKKSFSNSSTSEILYNQDYQAIKYMTENDKNHNSASINPSPFSETYYPLTL